MLVKRILLKAERVFCVNDIYLYKRITEPSGVGKMLQVLTTPGYLVKKIFRYMRKNGIKCTGIATFESFVQDNDRSGGMEDGKSIHTNAGMQC